ncbi:MAG: glycosyltransferase family 2 protein [Anaerolineae bacterium]|nr:glycosyltransferase family 2 protein [Phycisphaerae bacterium]
MALISVVVPIFNEQENLPELRRRMTASLDSTGDSWELVLVNDGSRDASPQMLREMNAEDPRIKVIDLSRNFGHQPAVTAGIHHARGDCVILIDGDLQDPPEVIPEMVAKWKQGHQVVLGERRSRAEGGTRGVGFKLFYPIFRRISDLPSAPDAGIFGLMDRVVVNEFNKLPERNRFIPGLRSWLGFKQTSVLYDRQDRAAGKPKQTLRRLMKYAMDGMVSFSYKPLRASMWLGFTVSGISFLLGVFYLIDFLRHRDKYGTGFTTLMLTMLFFGGVQLISVGVLGEYIGRIYEEIKQRPLYVVQEKLGFEPGDKSA